MNDKLEEPDVLMIFDELEVRMWRKKYKSVKRVLVKTILRPQNFQFTANITVPWPSTHAQYEEQKMLFILE